MKRTTTANAQPLGQQERPPLGNDFVLWVRKPAKDDAKLAERALGCVMEAILQQQKMDWRHQAVAAGFMERIGEVVSGAKRIDLFM